MVCVRVAMAVGLREGCTSVVFPFPWKFIPDLCTWVQYQKRRGEIRAVINRDKEFPQKRK